MASKEPGGSFGREGSSQSVIFHGEFFISCHSVDVPNHTHKNVGQNVKPDLDLESSSRTSHVMRHVQEERRAIV